MNKPELIKKFEECCTDPNMEAYRELFIKWQWSRHSYQFETKDGLLKITDIPYPQIILYHWARTKQAPTQYRLTSDEYAGLKKKVAGVVEKL